MKPAKIFLILATLLLTNAPARSDNSGTGSEGCYFGKCETAEIESVSAEAAESYINRFCAAAPFGQRRVSCSSGICVFELIGQIELRPGEFALSVKSRIDLAQISISPGLGLKDEPDINSVSLDCNVGHCIFQKFENITCDTGIYPGCNLDFSRKFQGSTISFSGRRCMGQFVKFLELVRR